MANMHLLDRIARGTLGTALVVFALSVTAVRDNPLLAALVIGFGVLNLFSAAIGFCPVYHVAGISTLKRSSTGAEARPH